MKSDDKVIPNRAALWSPKAEALFEQNGTQLPEPILVTFFGFICVAFLLYTGLQISGVFFRILFKAPSSALISSSEMWKNAANRPGSRASVDSKF